MNGQGSGASHPSRARRAAGIAVATAATLLVLDLLWLGVVARPLYDSALDSLRRPVVFWPAAGLVYALYVGAIVIHAERGAQSVRAAARRGPGSARAQTAAGASPS